MAITVSCPQCQKRFAAPDQWAGKTAQCTECGSDIPIPSTAIAPQQQLEWQPIIASPTYAKPIVRQPATIYWPLIIVVAIVFFALGFFVGREVLEWQQQRMLRNIGEQFTKQLNQTRP